MTQDDADRYFAYLDAMRESQTVMMYEAPDHLMTRFSLDRQTACRVVGEWMRSFGAVRTASDRFLTALRQTTPVHQDRRPGQTDAQYWLSWCATKRPGIRSPLQDRLCQIMLTEAAVETVGCDTARRWIFADDSTLCATAATVFAR